MASGDLIGVVELPNGKFEVHIFSWESHYQTATDHRNTPIATRTPNSFQWQVFRPNQSPDHGSIKPNIIGIQFVGTDDGQVHICELDGTNNFHSVVRQLPTALQTSSNERRCFLLPVFGEDLYCVHYSGTPSRKIEITILDAEQSYSRIKMHIVTPMDPIQYADFVLSPGQGNWQDLYAFNKQNPAGTSMSVLSGSKRPDDEQPYQYFLTQNQLTGLDRVDGAFTMSYIENVPNQAPIKAIARTGTGSNYTEVHTFEEGQHRLRQPVNLQETNSRWSLMFDYS